MEYIEQKLVAGQLNNYFNKVYNCEITKPTWKGIHTYGDTFFIKRRKSLTDSNVNKPDGDIVDSITIGGVEYVLIFNGNKIEVAYFDGNDYVGLGLDYNRTADTPYRLIEGKSGTGEFIDDITIGDAYYDFNNKGSWDSTKDYTYGDIVQNDNKDWISVESSKGKEPKDNTDVWNEYSTENSGYDKRDYINTPHNDVYKGSYLVLRIEKTDINKEDLVGKHILFNNNNSNLQGISTEIHYQEDSGNDDYTYVYIRGTNLSGTRPAIGEGILISSEVDDIPILATDTKVISLHIIKNNTTVSGVKEVVLYECIDGDNIVDTTIYNGVLFILTKQTLLYSRILTESNINIYPLDAFTQIKGGLRLVPFGKMLVLFGKNNAVITPINGTTGAVGYVYTDLNYDNSLFSKYSVISTMGSLYVLQDDKQFVQVDIKSVTNIDYDVTTKNVISNVRGMFDSVSGDIYINKINKDINILNVNGGATNIYTYNLEYLHWNIGQYPYNIYKLNNKGYGNKVYNLTSNIKDDDIDYDEEVSFDFGGDNLYILKQVQFIKLIFGLNGDILDYELEVEYQLGGNVITKTIDLKNYPINLELQGGLSGLGDSRLGTTLLGDGDPSNTVRVGNFVSVTVGLGLTGSLFNFTIRSKSNEFIYGGSIIGYDNKLPTVTEYNYKH